MAYTIKKSPHIQDEITIQGDDGEDLTLKVDIYVDDIMASLDEARAKLGRAQQAIAELKQAEAGADQVSEAYRALRAASFELFQLIFGPEQAAQLFGYYDGRTTAMLADFLPYFSKVIIPEVQKAQEALAERYRTWSH